MPKLETNGKPHLPPNERELKLLAANIKTALAAEAASDAETHKQRHAVGQWLQQASDMLPHGEFGGWLKANFNLSTTTAYRYMKFGKLPLTANLPVKWRQINNGHKNSKGTKSDNDTKQTPALYAAETERDELPTFNRMVERLRAELQAPSPFTAVLALLRRHYQLDAEAAQ